MSDLMNKFRVKGREIGDILRDVNAIMKERGVEAEEYDFSNMTAYEPPDERVWPGEKSGLRWVACFPVRGSNEGFYVHIELILQPMGGNPKGERRLISVAKCYSFENAVAMATIAAEIFEGKDSYERRWE